MKTNPVPEAAIEALIAQMTLDEKLLLCHGRSALTMGGIPRLGIPSITMFDGPQGVRLEDGRTATALPCGMALAATWDQAAAREFGAVIGRECRGAGGEASLGPGLNLMRTPLNGRNFEYYGEDPVLAGKIAGGYIDGCQGERVAATPKHLLLNNQEICRTVSSSEADERAIRELYIAAFEYVVRHHQPWMMMSSYNRIRGIYASQYGHAQQELIKDEFGFDGVMVSDWCAVHDARACALNGLDLEMGNGMESPFGEPLKKLVEAGEVPMTVIDEKVRRVLRLFYRTAAFEERKPAGEIDTPRHHRIARKLAQSAMTLLKNENNFLPLDRKTLRRIAVVGPNADYAHSMGPLETIGGSGGVHPAYEITPLAGLREYLGDAVEVVYAPGVRFANDAVIPAALLRTETGEPGLTAEYFHCGEALRRGEAPFFRCRDERMTFRWGEESLTAGGGGSAHKEDVSPEECFAVRWRGKLMPECEGRFKLMVAQSRGDSVVRIDGETVIDPSQVGRSGPLVQGAAELTLRSGRTYDIEIEFFRTRLELTEFKLLWEAADTATESMAEAVALARTADLVIYVGGTNHRYDREAIGGAADLQDSDIPGLEMPGRQAELIQALLEANPRTMAVLVHGSVVDVEGWIDRMPALLSIWYAGQEAGRALAEVLFGEVEPGGRLPFTWARKLEYYPCHANGSYPGTRGELSTNPQVTYPEGVFIGYRHFDRAPETVRFPFGFGLGYTAFTFKIRGIEFKNASVSDPEVRLSVEVRNTGRRAGSAVVQLYCGALEPTLPRPVKELRDFRKLELAPGASALVEFTLKERDFAFFDEEAGKFRVAPGPYEITVGYSAKTVADTIELTLR